MTTSLGSKLSALIGAAIGLGFVVVVSLYAVLHERSIFRQHERAVHQLTESVIQGLESVMLTGHADVAELYSARLKKAVDVVDFRILRTTGLEAFQDNQTIYRVNEIRGDEDFLPRKAERQTVVLLPEDKFLQDAVRSRDAVYYYSDEAGEPVLTFLWPVLNGKDCTKCHGKDHELRGLLKFSTSMAAVRDQVGQLRVQSGFILGGALLVIVIAVSILLRRGVVAPIRQVSDSMRRVSAGDLSREVPVLGRDELAEMAGQFNRMLIELRETYAGYVNEQGKLQTIILGARDGIVVTDDQGAVVLVNPAAQRFLEKPADKIMADGFEAMLDDPALIRRLLDDPALHADVVLYRERFLAITVAAIRADDGRLIGQMALLRDVSQAKRLEQTLRALSHTDGLTGLANRRLLAEVFDQEFARALQSGRPLSILVFDIDHFKLLNDRYGHAQGDEVLKAVADALRSSVRTIDLCCRYGGEEFLVVLTETAQDGAAVFAERIRHTIELMRVGGVHVTVSIGVAGLQESSAKTAAQLIELADQAMYAAKQGGRNRVVSAGRPIDA